MAHRLLKTGRKSLFCLIIIAGMAGLNAVAEEKQPAESPLDQLMDGEHCVSLARIDRTDVVDDRSILFYMKGNDIYLNRLPHRCPGLKWEKAFMYRTSQSQLCDLDIITVLDSMGFGYRPGVSCGLGMFFPISEETAKQIKAGELE